MPVPYEGASLRIDEEEAVRTYSRILSVTDNYVVALHLAASLIIARAIKEEKEKQESYERERYYER